MKKIFILYVLILGILVPSLALAYSWTRTPPGYTILNPITFEVIDWDTIGKCEAFDKYYWGLTYAFEDYSTFYADECYPTSQTSGTFVTTLPFTNYVRVTTSCWMSETCISGEGSGRILEFDGGNIIFEVVEPPPPPPPTYIPLPEGFTASILSNLGELFTDLGSLVGLTIGLPIGFWGVKKVISLAKFR